jgi:hypothetical protein
MLISKFDLTIAEYFSLAGIQKDEVAQADIVIIREYVPQGIFHSRSMRWKGILEGITNPYDFIRSKKEKKVAQEIRKSFEDDGYEFRIEPVTKKLFAEFAEVYENTTRKKQRPLPVNLAEQILGKALVKVPTFIIGMFKGKKLISGLAFSIKLDEAMVSVGAKQKFPKKRGGVGGVMEIELIRFCIERKLKIINHGISQNPAGVTSTAGVFEFKSRYGCSAFPEGEWYTSFILSHKVALSDLVFVTTHQDQLAQIVLSDSTENLTTKYQTHNVQTVIQRSLTEEIQKNRIFFGLDGKHE